MSKKLFLLIGLLAAIFQGASAQKQVSRAEQLWLAYFNQTRLSDKWGFVVDGQLRTAENFVNEFSLSALRAGATYYLSDRATVTAGYAYFHYYPGDNHKYVAQPEHRPWQQVQWGQSGRNFRLSQRVRLEERFRRKIENDYKLGEGYSFNYRARYNMQVSLPLSRKGFSAHTFSAVAADEVMVNFGKEIVYNTFDQNRFSAGMAYQFNGQNSLQALYMNVFQQLSSGNRYRTTHYIRLSYLHNLDWRKADGDKS
ncbi:DUF2490 domain-containing protein [Paraflavisolibacter sp. H34]|uniref:DUF2490 domain-containing protein n=1 Tax=Huijunlia imazamoxiresistens TaxID=3127457 RepID=UPI003018FC59